MSQNRKSDQRKSFVSRWYAFFASKEVGRDLGAGFAVAMLLVPQGLAYAKIAGLPPIMGLYAALPALLVYALLGSSKHLSVGPTAPISLLIFAGVGALTQGNSAKFVEYSMQLAWLVGLFLLLFRIFRLSILLEQISHAVLSGFLTAAAVYIGVSQVKHFFGFPAGIPTYNMYGIVGYAWENLGNIHHPTLFVGIASLVLFLLLPKIMQKSYVAFVVTGLAIFISIVFSLQTFGVKVVGTIPQGLPKLVLPKISVTSLKELLPIAFTISFVGFIESLSTSKALAQKEGYVVDTDREFAVLGVANLTSGLFGGFPVTGSISRTAVNYGASATSQRSSLFTFGFVALALVFFTPWLFYLPLTVLSAMIFVAVLRLIRIRDAVQAFHNNRGFFYEWVVTFVACLVVGLDKGLFLGIAFSVLRILRGATKTNISEWAILQPKESAFQIQSQEQRNQASIAILRFENHLPSGDCYPFFQEVQKLICQYPFVKTVIFDLRNQHFLSAESAEALLSLNQEFAKDSITVAFCHVQQQPTHMLLHGQSSYLLVPIMIFDNCRKAWQDALDGQFSPPITSGKRKENWMTIAKNPKKYELLKDMSADEITAWEARELSFHGIPEVNVDWVKQWMSKFRVIDIREEHELVSELGHIDGVEHVPMNAIPDYMDEWDQQQPIVLMCRSGGRTTRMAYYLLQSGFEQVASVNGGMKAWNEKNFPISTVLDS